MSKEYADAFSDAFLEVLPQLGISEIGRISETECGKKIDSQGVVCIVGIVGDLAGNVIYSMSEETAKLTASGMMGGMEVEAFDEIAQSAISELCNMLAANACIALSAKDLTLDISTPTLLSGVFSMSGSYEPVLQHKMQLLGCEFDLFVSLDRRA